jgi:DNA repair exonuclease SbcCD ATPase subunit
MELLLDSELITRLRERVNKDLAALAIARTRYREEVQALETAQETKEALREALSAAQGVAQVVQEEAHRKIADVVSQSLEAVFDEPYQFRIIFEQKRGRTEARLVFVRDGMEVDPMTASGGGVVDVAAFALRLSCLLLSRPPLRRVLILDEPFRFVSVEYRSRGKELLQTLSKELDVQFILVTHIADIQCGSVIQL